MTTTGMEKKNCSRNRIFTLHFEGAFHINHSHVLKTTLKLLTISCWLTNPCTKMGQWAGDEDKILDIVGPSNHACHVRYIYLLTI